MEKRAKELGVNTIRLDTFDWQGYAFYKSLGYEEVGHYYNEEDDYHEYFFVKRIAWIYLWTLKQNKKIGG